MSEPEILGSADDDAAHRAAWARRPIALLAPLAAPLPVLVGACALFAVQAGLTAPGAQESAVVARTLLLSHRLSTTLDEESGATLSWTRSTTSESIRAELTRARTATDQAARELTAATTTPPDGRSWPLEVQNAHSDLDEALGRLAFIRSGVDQGNTPMVIVSGYTRELQSATRLTGALAGYLSSSAPDVATERSASALTALTEAFSAASEESVRLTTALQEGRLSDNSGITLQELKVSQNIALEQAGRHLVGHEQDLIDGIRQDDDRLDDFRDTALKTAQDGVDPAGQSPAALTARRSTEAATYSVVARGRVSRLDELMTQVAGSARDRVADRSDQSRTRMITAGVTGVLLLLLVMAIKRRSPAGT